MNMNILALVALIQVSVVLAQSANGIANGIGNGIGNGNRNGIGNGNKWNHWKEVAFTISSEEFHSILPPVQQPPVAQSQVAQARAAPPPVEQISVEVEPPQDEQLSAEEAPVEHEEETHQDEQLSAEEAPVEHEEEPHQDEQLSAEEAPVEHEEEPHQDEQLSAEEAPAKPPPIQQPSDKMPTALGATDMPSIPNAAISEGDKSEGIAKTEARGPFTKVQDGVKNGLPAASLANQASPNNDPSSNDPSSNVTIGIVIGSILGILALVFGIFIVKSRKSRNKLSVCSDATIDISVPTAEFMSELDHSPSDHIAVTDKQFVRHKPLPVGPKENIHILGTEKVTGQDIPDSKSDYTADDMESFSPTDYQSEAPDPSYYTAAPNTYTMFLQEAAEEQVIIEETIISPDKVKYGHLSIGTIVTDNSYGGPNFETKMSPHSLISSSGLPSPIFHDEYDSGIQDLDEDEFESFAPTEDPYLVEAGEYEEHDDIERFSPENQYSPNNMSFYTEAPDNYRMSYFTAAPNTYSMFLQEAAEEQGIIEETIISPDNVKYGHLSIGTIAAEGDDYYT
jgi:hypothetical protein